MDPNTTEHEIELKNLLDADQFNALCIHFKATREDAKYQVNHFFDTANHDLLNQVVTLRARQKQSDKWELTIKSDHPDGGRLEQHHRPLLGEERELLFSNGTIPPGLLREALHNFTTLPVEYCGQQETHRITIELPRGLGSIMLDRSVYLDTIDFEIELEINTSDQDKTAYRKKVAERYFKELLDQYEIKQEQPRNKTQRFFDVKLQNA